MAEMTTFVPDNSKNTRIDAGEYEMAAGQRVVCEVVNEDDSIDHTVVDDSVPASNTMTARIWYEGNLLPVA